MSPMKVVLALICLGVSVSLSMEQRADFNDVHLQGKADHDVNDQGLKILIQQQSAAIEQLLTTMQHQSEVNQQQSAAIQTLEAKVQALQSHKTHRLVKRSDDVSIDALQVLVQQQAATIQQQAATIQTLQAKVTSLEAKESQTDAKVTALDCQARKQVAFSVSFTQDGTAINIGQNAPLQFTHIVTNTGNEYDQHTGIFTAPSSGLYAFFLMVRAHGSESGTTAVGIINTHTHEELCHAKVEGSSPFPWDKDTCFITAHLRQGDQIHAQRLYGGPTIDKGWQTGFSGLLISADL